MSRTRSARRLRSHPTSHRTVQDAALCLLFSVSSFGSAEMMNGAGPYAFTCPQSVSVAADSASTAACVAPDASTFHSTRAE